MTEISLKRSQHLTLPMKRTSIPGLVLQIWIERNLHCTNRLMEKQNRSIENQTVLSIFLMMRSPEGRTDTHNCFQHLPILANCPEMSSFVPVICRKQEEPDKLFHRQKCCRGS